MARGIDAENVDVVVNLNLPVEKAHPPAKPIGFRMK
jgi:superfamily II DNA/RNA helicase